MRFLICSLFLSVVYAHWIVSSPPTRGWNDSTNPNPPCGGFSTPEANRVLYPATGLTVGWTILDGVGVVSILFGTGSNPSTFAATGQSFGVNATGQNGLGDYVETIILPGITSSTVGTIQFIYNDTESEPFYQCIDITGSTPAPSSSSSPSDGSSLVPVVFMSLSFVVAAISLFV